MGLLMDIETASGIKVKDAYINIFEYSSINGLVNAKMRAYVSKSKMLKGMSYLEGGEYLLQLQVTYDDDSTNSKKQIYEYVKLQDNFINAKDSQ